MSTVCGDIRKERIGYSLFFCATLSGIPQCVKPLVRAEPDEPKAPYSSVTPLRLRIVSLHSMITEYASCCEKSSKMYNFSPENVQVILRHKVYKSLGDGFPV